MGLADIDDPISTTEGRSKLRQLQDGCCDGRGLRLWENGEPSPLQFFFEFDVHGHRLVPSTSRRRQPGCQPDGLC